MSTGTLMTYNPLQQHWGTFLLGYDWNIYGCGTYREPISSARADVLLPRFMERLGRKLHAPVSYFAALERRYSGCGIASIPVHWHFVAACQHAEGIREASEHLWSKHFGNCKIDLYDPQLDGVFYISKLAAHPNGEFKFENLELLDYRGPSDLVEAAHANPYVPAHLKDRTHGEYLVVR